MKHLGDLSCFKLAVVAFAVCLLAGSAFAGKHKDLEPDDPAQAQQWVEEGLDHFKDVKVTDQYISFSDGQKTNVIPLARIYWTNLTRKHSGRFVYDVVQWKDYAQEPLIGYVQERETHGNEKHMERLKAALDYLVAGAHERAITHNDALLEQFRGQAKAWREAAVKATMPESAREHQVLAEFAFKEKNVDKAIMEYTAALEIFPTWPEGQFNLATLAGEKKLYGTAIFHMKEYLELVPESADAQAARDSIIVWKDKLNSYFPANDGSRPQLKNVSEEH